MMSVVRELPPSDSACQLMSCVVNARADLAGYESVSSLDTAHVSTIRQFSQVERTLTHFPVSQRVDDHTQRGQRLIDLLGFLKRLTGSSSLADLSISSDSVYGVQS